LTWSLYELSKEEKRALMPRIKNDRLKRTSIKKHRNVKNEAIMLTKRAGFNQETEESLIKEIEEICVFEDSLKD
jgi:hypothetical protein